VKIDTIAEIGGGIIVAGYALMIVAASVLQFVPKVRRLERHRQDQVIGATAAAVWFSALILAFLWTWIFGLIIPVIRKALA
jgi:hypothetical protein